MFKPDTNLTHQDDGSYTKVLQIPQAIDPGTLPDIDLQQAQQFLPFIAGGEDKPKFHWQCWDDDKQRKDPNLIYFTSSPRAFSKDLQNELIKKNRAGAGVGVTINAIKGRRSNANVQAIRALYVDYDLPVKENPFKAEPRPHLVIQSSAQKYHAYWKVHDCSVEAFEGIQKALAIFCYGPDADLRDVDMGTAKAGGVMRCPGFIHQKPGAEPFLSRIIEVNPGPDYSINDLKQAYGLVIPEPQDTSGETTATKHGYTINEILTHISNNEVGDAAIYKALAGGRYCFDYPTTDWYIWNGSYWEPDIVEGHINLMSEVIDIYQDAAKQVSIQKLQAITKDNKPEADRLQEQEKAIIQRIYALQSKKRISNVISLACPDGEGSKGLGIPGDKWDQKLYFLPCKNGLVDLHTGDLYEGLQSDYISLVAPHEFIDLSTPCPAWETFLEQVIVDEAYNTDLKTIDFLQKFLGMSLTGDVSEHLFAIFWGAGRNGKSTLFETLSYVLGPLVKKLKGEMLLSTGRPRDSAGARPDLMELRGRRLCWANETDEGRKLDISLVKELSGGDTISARALYKGMTSFRPTHTIALSTNYKPRIPTNPVDPIWDRILMFPFRLRFTSNPKEAHERAKDPKLRHKLEKEAPGILAWLVRGAIEWHKLDTFDPPANVTKAIKGYQAEEDIVGQFLEECCDMGPEMTERGGRLYSAYKEWATRQGLYALTKTKFGSDIARRFERDGKETKFKQYKGLSLRTTEEQGTEGACPNS